MSIYYGISEGIKVSDCQQVWLTQKENLEGDPKAITKVSDFTYNAWLKSYVNGEGGGWQYTNADSISPSILPQHTVGT